MTGVRSVFVAGFRELVRRSVAVVAAGLFALSLSALVSPAVAQTAPPSPEDVLAYGIGERFTDVAGMNRYMQALADASPLVSIEQYGESYEGRPLIQVVIASAANRARLDEILAANRELTDPDLPGGRAEEIIRENPLVLYFSYGVHGNESSSTEAAMWTAWDLARGDATVAGVLDSAVVVLDPSVNPDGRDRYVNWYRMARGMEPNPNLATREHQEPWPGGRTNHYYFDLNRDWSWATQAETQQRLATWDRWNPQVHVDFHEMFVGSTYFFFPATAPINPIYPQHVLEWGERFGNANAAAFDERGWLYYTGEDFDLFYPGYGDSWPSLVGAIGMTYEQAGHSAGGRSARRPDGTLLTLADRAQHHRIAGNTTLRTAAEGRQELLRGFRETYRTVDAGLDDVLLVPDATGDRLRALVRQLRRQGIEVERAERAFTADGDPHLGFAERERFPAGTHRVRMRQPRGRVAGVLLRPDNVLDAEYSYDITAWSLPFAHGIEAHGVETTPDAEWVSVDEVRPPVPVEGSATVGYLIRPALESRRALVDFMEAGGRARLVTEPFTVDGLEYERGAVFLPSARNDDLGGRVAAAGLEPWAEPVSTGLTSAGSDLGTDRSAALELPKVALLSGRGTNANSFGAHWFFLEHRLGIPHDVILAESVAGQDLEEWDVIVVPESWGLGGVLGEAGREALAEWTREGGTLVAVGSGATGVVAALAEVERRTDGGAGEDEMEREERLDRALRTREERQREGWEQSMPGTILAASIDPRHPLSYGLGTGDSGDRLFVLSGGDSFEPDDSFESPAWFPAEVERIAGVVSDENLERLARSTWLAEKRMGEGRVVLFADDPLFRLFWHSGFLPYVNAILLGGVM